MVTMPVGHIVDGVGAMTCKLGGSKIGEQKIGNWGKKMGDSNPAFDTVSGDSPTATPLQKELAALAKNNFMQEGSYQLKNMPRVTGKIDVKELAEKVIDHYGMNRSALKTHLLVASDGIVRVKIKDSDFEHSLKQFPSFDLVNKRFIPAPDTPADAMSPDRMLKQTVEHLYAKARNDENIAQAMVVEAKKYMVADNIALTLVKDIGSRAGTAPIVTYLCDAAGKDPALSSQIAVRSISDTLREIDQSQGIALRFQERVTKLVQI